MSNERTFPRLQTFYPTLSLSLFLSFSSAGIVRNTELKKSAGIRGDSVGEKFERQFYAVLSYRFAIFFFSFFFFLFFRFSTVHIVDWIRFVCISSIVNFSRV